MCYRENIPKPIHRSVYKILQSNVIVVSIKILFNSYSELYSLYLIITLDEEAMGAIAYPYVNITIL